MNPPWGYQPPEKLAHYFKKSTSSNSIDAEAADSSPRLCEVIERDKVGFCSEEDIGDARELIEASRLDPKRLKRDFLSLLTVAGEIKEKDKASEDDISMSYSPLPQIPRLPSLKQSCESSSSQRLPSLPEAAPENFIDALRSQGYISGTKDFAMYGNPYTGNPFYQNYLMGTGYGHYFPHGPTTMPILPNTDSRSVPDISRGARVNYPSFPTLGGKDPIYSYMHSTILMLYISQFNVLYCIC